MVSLSPISTKGRRVPRPFSTPMIRLAIPVYHALLPTRMQTVLEMLTSKLEAVDTQLSTLASSPRPPADVPGPPGAGGAGPAAPSAQEVVEMASEEEQNRAFLKTLEVEQVILALSSFFS